MIRLTVSFMPNALSIEVADDGQGFVVNVAYTETGYGIQGMRERIDSLGGRVEIESAPGVGTAVRIHISRYRLEKENVDSRRPRKITEDRRGGWTCKQ
jgi:signal transduction histidine kinase